MVLQVFYTFLLYYGSPRITVKNPDMAAASWILNRISGEIFSLDQQSRTTFFIEFQYPFLLLHYRSPRWLDPVPVRGT
jgi:hypothetical protein